MSFFGHCQNILNLSNIYFFFITKSVTWLQSTSGDVKCHVFGIALSISVDTAAVSCVGFENTS